MKDYSQNGEQAAIIQVFAGDMISGLPGMGGRFLDIGAFSPFDNSNTRALYELGWSGVMVEPSPGAMRALAVEYGQQERITLVQCAVGLAPRLATIHVTDDALSTVDEAHLNRCEAAGYKFYAKMLVPQLTLDRLFMEVGNKFDFVSIDVEGGSADLCLQLLSMISEHPQSYREAVAPRCIIVEHDNRVTELVNAAGAKGYRVALKNGENLVLVRG